MTTSVINYFGGRCHRNSNDIVVNSNGKKCYSISLLSLFTWIEARSCKSVASFYGSKSKTKAIVAEAERNTEIMVLRQTSLSVCSIAKWKH